MRRIAVALALLAPAACGLAFSPGDFRESGETAASPGLDGSAPNDAGPASTTEAATDAGPTRTRIALFAGRRDAVAGEANGQVAIAETMLTWIDADGNLGPFTFDEPPPASASWTHATLVDGKMYVHTTSAVAIAPFTDRFTGAWTLLSFPAVPPLQTGLKGWALDSRGLYSGRSASPGSDPSAFIATFPAMDGGSIGGWSALTAQTAVARGNTRLVRGGNHVYIVGGDTPTAITDPIGPAIPAHSEVEVATLSDNGELGSFHSTTALPAVTDAGTAFTTFDPVAVANADRLYLLGGLTTSSTSSVTDVALAAKVKDPATGDLDTWTTLPRLPERMNAFAAIITPAWLVIFGGGTTGAARDLVLRLAIHADGSFGSAWETAGHLPGPRASIVGVTY